VFAVVFGITGVALALLVGWLACACLGRRFSWVDLGLGLVVFFLAGIVQNVLVSPVALALHGAQGLSPLVPSSPLEAIYYGLAAGVAQEGGKAVAIVLRSRRLDALAVAIATGSGFAMAEILYLALGTVSSHAPLSLAVLAMPLWERCSAIFFHIGSALLIAWGLRARRFWLGLALAALLHALTDANVSLMAYARIVAVVPFESANFVYSLAVLAVALILARRVRALE